MRTLDGSRNLDSASAWPSSPGSARLWAASHSPRVVPPFSVFAVVLHCPANVTGCAQHVGSGRTQGSGRA